MAEVSQADRRPEESQRERLARNFNELLQELRVTQTGVQILTGFLLTVPFSARFTTLTSLQRGVYLAVLCGSVLANGLIVAPVAFHRTLFRRGERPWIIEAANKSARAGLLMLALTITGVVWLVFDVVTSRTAAHVAGTATLVFFGVLWLVIPYVSRRR